MKKIYFVLTFIYLLPGLSPAQAPFVDTDSKTKKSGIKDGKTKKWLTLPTFSDIKTISHTADQKEITDVFIAKKGNKKILISKNGITPLSPLFDEIESIPENQNLFIVKTKSEFSFFENGKGILKSVPPFTTYKKNYPAKNYYFLFRANSVFIFRADKKTYNPNPYTIIVDDPVDSSDSSPTSFIVKKDKWGLVEYSGKEVISAVYDSISNFGDVLGVKKGNQWALMDANGKTILDFKYENIKIRYTRVFPEVFSINFLPVKSGDKWGIINAKGETAVPFLYDDILGADSMKRIVVKKEGKMGWIDTAGKTVFPFLYSYFERIDQNFFKPTKEKYLLVNNGCSDCDLETTEGKWGMADGDGKIILEANANCIKIFMAYKLYSNPDMEGYEDSVLLGYLWNVGGEKIKTIVRVDSTEMIDDDGNPGGIATYTTYGYTLRNGKTGIVDRFGKFILPPVFDKFGFCIAGGDIPFANQFTDNTKKTGSGYAVDTAFLIIAVKEKKAGVYNFKGKEIIPCIYDSIFSQRSNYDASDSVFSANGYPKSFFKVYKNNNYGYVSTTGKELCAPVIQTEVNTLFFAPYDSIVSNENYSPDYNKITSANVTVNNTEIKKYIIYSTLRNENSMEDSRYGLAFTDTFDYVAKGKINFLNGASMNLISDKWVDDFILISKTLLGFQFSKPGCQLNINAVENFDSLKEKDTGEKIQLTSAQLRYYSDQGYFLEYMFVKSEGKWYLKNIFRSGFINAAMPFDSVQVMNLKFFKGFKNGKYSYYNFKSTNFPAPEINFEYPDDIYSARMICGNCNYSLKKVVGNRKGYAIDPNTGEPLDVWTRDTLEIPFVQKGTFNLIGGGSTDYILKNFADEILLASPFTNYSVDFTNENSGLYDTLFWYKAEGWPLFFDTKNSMAARNGATWLLTTTNKTPAITFNGFQKVQYRNNFWYAIKDGKLYIYRADSLSSIAPRILDFSDIDTKEPLNISMDISYFYVTKKNGFGLISEDGSVSAAINNYEAIDRANSFIRDGFGIYSQQDFTNHFVLKYKGKWGVNCLNQLMAVKLGILNDSIQLIEKRNIENPVIKFEYDSIKLVPFLAGKIFQAFKNGKSELFTTAGQRLPPLAQVKTIPVSTYTMINFTDGNPEGFNFNERVSLLCNKAVTKKLDTIAVQKAAGNNIDGLAKDLVKTEFVTGASSCIIAESDLNKFYTDTLNFQQICFVYSVFSETKDVKNQNTAFCYDPFNESSYLDWLAVLKSAHEIRMESIIMKKNNKYSFTVFSDMLATGLKDFKYDSFSIEKAKTENHPGEAAVIKLSVNGKHPEYFSLKGEQLLGN